MIVNTVGGENPVFTDPKPDVKQCVLGRTVYIKTHYLYSCEKQTEWVCNTHLPFMPRKGQSMTACENSIVFFGGFDSDGNYHNDIWIYENKQWYSLSSNVDDRAFHAACYIGNNKLLISGGENQNTIFDDFIIIDLKTGNSEKFIINEGPQIKRSNHSLTFVDENTIYIVGGNDNIKNILTCDIFVLSLIDKKITEIETISKIQGFGSHSCSYVPGNLIITPHVMLSFPSSNLWFFNLDNKIWIPCYYQNPNICTYIDGITLCIVGRDSTKITNARLFPMTNKAEPKKTYEYTTYMENLTNNTFKLINQVKENDVTPQNFLHLAERLKRNVYTKDLPEMPENEVEPLIEQIKMINKISEEPKEKISQMKKEV